MLVEHEFTLTTQDFDWIRTLVTEQTGIVLSEAKRDLVYGRLTKRLRHLGLDSFRAYCQRLQAGDPGELEHLVNALTTNLTMFFREVHHFDYLADTVLPALLARHAQSRRLRLWSAGCSTGEEPYSLAMVCREVVPANAGWDVKILATDIDSSVLATAQQGIYSAERVQGMSPERLQHWFRKGQGQHAGLVRVSPALQELITFRQLNLIHPLPMRGPFDVIFCRNVVIYFDKPTQRQLFERFADVLDPQGHLFVGHSESLFKVTERFALLGKTIYRRCR
ncbi:MAG: protein-glutamate O-methyltransferase CheR [Candidatus Tectomicrobia bacterium]|uniref:protein-glutamate O-methyltransferase n=1 Tax=Tectimicrobiota bacterium TaxID=2528274 RepID=A0A937W0P0_UNCTE|nr:protein-glutamate O-methyltransferase CheR [Candidatus Tectomicrobia bacterium]